MCKGDTTRLPSKSELQAAIPRHCFERNATYGFYFILRDIIVMGGFAFAASLMLKTSLPDSLLDCLIWVFGWTLYAFAQGTAATGIWVIAHECGHGAFSPSQTLNDCVGFVLHSVLLVPYFAWQFSHKKHHLSTNHLIVGETHVPPTAKGFGIPDESRKRSRGMAKLYEALGEDAFAVVQIIGHLVLGWPLYLLQNDTGGRTTADGGRKTGKHKMDHFRPSSALFPVKVKPSIYLSTGGIFAVLASLVWASCEFGSMSVLCYYWGPYMWTNAWLVLYTWLHHTDPELPHYGKNSEYTWLKGAISTIDRDYGIFDWFHHDIGSTHVCHHLFSKIPFYHAREATVHIKGALGPLYHYDSAPIPLAMWKVAKECHFVQSVDGVQYYQSMSSVIKGSKKL